MWFKFHKKLGNLSASNLFYSSEEKHETTRKLFQNKPAVQKLRGEHPKYILQQTEVEARKI